MPAARVKWFDNRRGFGYLELEDGREAFVHHTGIEAGGFRTLRAGDAVTCEVRETDRGPRAERVRRA